MSKYAVLLGFIVILAGGLWTAATVAFPNSHKDCSPARGSKEKIDDVLAHFETLKKQLPKITSTWCASVYAHEPTVRVARLTSPTEAKYTFETKLEDLSEFAKTCLFTLYLRYYDGVWTVLRWEAGGDNINQANQPFIHKHMQKLAMAIDQIAGK